LVTDGTGNHIRYPIRLSNFKERPKFYQSQKEKLKNEQSIEKEHNHQQQKLVGVLSMSPVSNLLKLIPQNYSKEKNQKLRIKRRRKGRQRRY